MGDIIFWGDRHFNESLYRFNENCLDVGHINTMSSLYSNKVAKIVVVVHTRDKFGQMPLHARNICLPTVKYLQNVLVNFLHVLGLDCCWNSKPVWKSEFHDSEQGWHSGESTRLPPMWPGFESRTRRHKWVEFFVGSHPCSEGFSPGTPVFLPLQKPTLLNSNFIWDSSLLSQYC